MNKTVTVLGQGYVGLPLAKAATQAGWKVFGFDIQQAIVDQLNSGRSHVDDLTDGDIAAMLEGGYEATTNPNVVAESSVVVICVPTPLGEGGGPDLTAVRQSASTVANHLQRGTVVILESTTYPGTTEEVLTPILDVGSGLKAMTDFDVAFSPERVNPGDPVYGISNTPKLVGGVGAHAAHAARSFYESFIEDVIVLSSPKEAETAKLLENTFRHVNIALVNEMAKFCYDMGIDIWEVIRGAATKPFGFMPFTPGPGVGGHCIPIDPNYLAHEVRNKLGYSFRFVELAQEINNSMPEYVVSRIAELLNEQERPIKGSRILLLGVTYKPNIADQRESPAIPIAEKLQRRGARVSYHDPYVTTWAVNGDDLHVVTDLHEAVSDSEVVILLQAHDAYNIEDLQGRAKLFFDTQGKSSGVRL